MNRKEFILQGFLRSQPPVEKREGCLAYWTDLWAWLQERNIAESDAAATARAFGVQPLKPWQAQQQADPEPKPTGPAPDPAMLERREKSQKLAHLTRLRDMDKKGGAALAGQVAALRQELGLPPEPEA